MINNKEFASGKEASIYLNHIISSRTIRLWCKNQDKKITNRIYSHSKYLKLLGTIDIIVGKSFKDIGFSFTSI